MLIVFWCNDDLYFSYIFLLDILVILLIGYWKINNFFKKLKVDKEDL